MAEAVTHLVDGDGTKPVPFVDLSPVTRDLQDAILHDLVQVVESGMFVNGRAVAAFEDAFAETCGRSFCVGLASGLDALSLTLSGLDVRPGDEVIVPAMTFVATFEAVVHAGGRPVPVDVRRDDCCIDPDALEAAVSGRSRVLMPVHLYGQVADMARIEEIARRRDLVVVEDACQAHGAIRDGGTAGSWGRAAAFSFYPSKNLGAWGDAGALVTDDEELTKRVRALRQHGERERYISEYVGHTARLDTIQAVVLLHKLPLLDEWNEQRRQAAELYTSLLEGVGDLRLPMAVAGSIPAWHVYAVQTGDPEKLGRHLAERGVATGRHYPEPPHLSQALAWLGHGPGSFPVAEEIATKTLSLPLYAGIPEADVSRVVSAVRGFFDRG